jgi:2-polyprenyl-3-methyl-5-hydroxy-6-metoxy-1,4-benzoquinol methylase
MAGPDSAFCRVCESRNTQIMALLQSEVDGQTYEAVKCKTCGVLFSSPMPELSVENLQRIYGPDYTEDMMGLSAGDEALGVHRASINRQMDIVERYIQKGHALNVGAMGGAIKVLEERGWKLRLVDVSRVAAETARKRWDLDVTISRLEDFDCPDGSFDFVRLGHVIEHLADPKVALRRIAQILRPGGVLQVETDNAQGLRTRIEFLVRWLLGEPLSERLVRVLTKKNLRKRYGRLIPPVHLYSFSPGNLTRLLEETGFEVIIAFKPAWGDPTWFPMTDQGAFSPVERAFIRLDQLGARFGLGDVIALLARRT